MRPDKLMARLRTGAVANTSFADARQLLEAHGFSLARTRGSHHVFIHPAVEELVNLQSVHGEAKPYQLRQILRLIDRYNLSLPEGS